LQVIASGGVSSVIEIERLARSGVVAGAIIGMALYKGQLTMNQALKAARAGLDAG
jgi:phosphoribosylformimino-5-aminoimidazole carboxamide ribonucleotide (ProFAR) isomerase